MEDYDIIKIFVKQANENSRSKTKVANFIMEDTGQKLYVFTAEQLNLFGIGLAYSVHSVGETGGKDEGNI